MNAFLTDGSGLRVDKCQIGIRKLMDFKTLPDFGRCQNWFLQFCSYQKLIVPKMSPNINNPLIWCLQKLMVTTSFIIIISFELPWLNGC